MTPPAATPATTPATVACPRCGADRIPGAAFCEQCAFEFTDVLDTPAPTAGVEGAEGVGGGAASPAAADPSVGPGEVGPADAGGGAAPVTAAPGEESPLDVGWTGVVASAATSTEGAAAGTSGDDTSDGGPVCQQCGEGHFQDGYCDTCGAKQPDPRDHFREDPADWVAGVCDIGKRHRRNEDALALYAEASPGSFAVLVVCDGVSNSTDSHIASLAAARAAREVLQQPLPRGVGTRTALVSAAEQRLADAVSAADAAVERTTAGLDLGPDANPPSCTFVAGLVVAGDPGSAGAPPVAVVGNVGDSRAYWLPDADDSTPRQLTVDDSYAAEQMSAGVPRKEAETGPGAHAITRWLGSDSPDDLTPHTSDLEVSEPGWLLVCSDGLWNYCSEAADLRDLVRSLEGAAGHTEHTEQGVEAAALTPATLAAALTDFANGSGGADNITVALARIERKDIP